VEQTASFGFALLELVLECMMEMLPHKLRRFFDYP
jgi:hypothetical protein